MNTITTAQIKCAKAIMGKLKLQDNDALVLGFSDMRTTHVSEMTVDEGIALIKHLKTLDPDEAKADKMRKKIIAIAYSRAGLARSAGREERRAVIAHLEDWMLKYSYLKKRLDDYKARELPKLVTQYENVLKSDLKRL